MTASIRVGGSLGDIPAYVERQTLLNSYYLNNYDAFWSLFRVGKWPFIHRKSPVFNVNIVSKQQNSTTLNNILI